MGQNGYLGLLLIVTVVMTMLSLGMSLTRDEIHRSFRRLGLLLRAALAAFGVSVAWTWLVVRVLEVPRASAGALLLLMCLPPAATAARLSAIARADRAFAVAMLVFLSMASLIATPLLLALVLPVEGPVDLDRMQIVATLLALVIAPGAAGVLLRGLSPSLADRLERPVTLIANVVLIAVLVVLMWTRHAALLGLGGFTLGAVVLVFAGTMVAGWTLTGPAPATRFAGANACSGRNAGIALLIVTVNFPASRIGDENLARVIATLVAYGLFELTAGVALAVYHGRRRRADAEGAGA